MIGNEDGGGREGLFPLLTAPGYQIFNQESCASAMRTSKRGAETGVCGLFTPNISLNRFVLERGNLSCDLKTCFFVVAFFVFCFFEKMLPCFFKEIYPITAQSIWVQIQRNRNSKDFAH